MPRSHTSNSRSRHLERNDHRLLSSLIVAVGAVAAFVILEVLDRRRRRRTHDREDFENAHAYQRRRRDYRDDETYRDQDWYPEERRKEKYPEVEGRPMPKMITYPSDHHGGDRALVLHTREQPSVMANGAAEEYGREPPPMYEDAYLDDRTVMGSDVGHRAERGGRRHRHRRGDAEERQGRRRQPPRSVWNDDDETLIDARYD